MNEQRLIGMWLDLYPFQYDLAIEKHTKICLGDHAIGTCFFSEDQKGVLRLLDILK